MAISINGNGTITGISVGGLPNGIVDTDTIAASAVTPAKSTIVGGKILQVLQVKKTDVFTTTNTTNSGTHPWGNDVSGLSLNITMTNASNKVLAILNGTISNSATNYYTYLYLYRHSDYFLGSSTAKTPSGSLATNDVVVMGLDTPGAGTHMYLARVATEGNTAKVGQGQNDSGHNENIGDSTLTLMEIAA